jgi:hypothetical protein
MGSHDVLRAAMIAQVMEFERDRQLKIRQQHALAKARENGQISELSWFGGIKATASFLIDAARAGFSQRRMTEARS